MALQPVEDASLYLIKNGDTLGASNELGMGFQFCHLLDGPIMKHLIVLNQLIGFDVKFYSEIFYGVERANKDLDNIIEMMSSFESIKISSILDEIKVKLPGFFPFISVESITLTAEYKGIELKDVEVDIEDSRQAFYKFVNIKSDMNDKLPEFRERLHGSPPFSGTTRPGHKFIRFSAFRYDRRITADDGLLRGSYATSASDARMVPNALAAVGRYALPNPVPAVHKFEIHPPPGTNIKYGTVTPQFNQSGGGAEVEFGDPLPPGSVVYKGTIPIW